MEGLRNAAVERRIAERLQANGGRMTFADYMHLCLYEPGIGYYQRDAVKLGKEGDFYTSAHIGRAMGFCIASALAAAARRLAPGGEDISLVEWGGGEGRLAAVVLDELRRTHPDIYSRVRFVGAESSPGHREAQRDRLGRHAERIEALCGPEDAPVERALAERTTLLFANELLDAFPVHLLIRRRGRWRELYVEEGQGAEETLREAEGELSSGRLADWLDRHPIDAAEGQRIEVSLAALDWIAGLGARMRRGYVLFADYGDVSAELYGRHRLNGTLLAYRRHRATDRVLEAPGAQDLTAHVNFEWCREAAEEAGFQEVGLETQKRFLVENGIFSLLKDHAGGDPFSPEARTNRAVRQLLLSDGMSELFKIMTMYKPG